MSDPVKSAVGKYVDPTNAGELAHAIEVWMLSEFGRSCSGGCDGDGGAMDYDLDGEDATVLVGSTAEIFNIKRHLRGDERFVMLDDDEIKLVEAHRAAKHGDDRGDDPRESSGSINDVGAVESEYVFVLDGVKTTVETWFGPAAEWDDEHPDSGFVDAWTVVRVDDLVQAVRLTVEGTRRPARYAAEALAPSVN
jgi:hypothetical protein